MPRKKLGKRERQQKKLLSLCKLTPIEIQLNEAGLPLTPRVLGPSSPLPKDTHFFIFSEPSSNSNSRPQTPTVQL